MRNVFVHFAVEFALGTLFFHVEFTATLLPVLRCQYYARSIILGRRHKRAQPVSIQHKKHHDVFDSMHQKFNDIIVLDLRRRNHVSAYDLDRVIIIR